MNNSFVESSGGHTSRGTRESMELMKANYERDEHKWNAEKLAQDAKIKLLEDTIRVKDDDAARQLQHREKNFDRELQLQIDTYEE